MSKYFSAKADSNVVIVTADVHPCSAPTVSAIPGHLNVTTTSTCVHTQAFMKARDIIEMDLDATRDIIEMDLDAIIFADDADAHADLNTREDSLHHVSNEMTPADRPVPNCLPRKERNM